MFKSVQPDSASPEHSSRIIAYSRSFYFCIITILVLILDGILNSGFTSGKIIQFYGITLATDVLLSFLLNVFLGKFFFFF